MSCFEDLWRSFLLPAGTRLICLCVYRQIFLQHTFFNSLIILTSLFLEHYLSFLSSENMMYHVMILQFTNLP